jgi:hypothetical protein
MAVQASAGQLEFSDKLGGPKIALMITGGHSVSLE